MIRKLREAGAVLVAKLAMVELAGGFGYNTADASFTGPGRTPWNTNYWSGGSSSGPGAATAAGLCAFTIGSETSGSIITPAAFCGVSGLRPTYGRVSRHGAMALSWTLDKLGPMCRSADDCGIVLAAIAGRDPRDASSVSKAFNYPENPKENKKYRLGVVKGATTGCMPAVVKNFETSLEVLRKQGCVIDTVSLPAQPFGAVVSTIISAEAANSFREFLDSGRTRELRAPNDRWGGFAGTMVLAVDYLQAMRVRTVMKRAMEELYAKYDAIVAPSRATVAYPADGDFDKAYPKFRGGSALIPAGNVVGQPAISVPNGFGDNNLPTGIQFTGRAWSEARLLTLAHLYQRTSPTGTRGGRR